MLAGTGKWVSVAPTALQDYVQQGICKITECDKMHRQERKPCIAISSFGIQLTLAGSRQSAADSRWPESLLAFLSSVPLLLSDALPDSG
jgi:transposase